MRHLLSRSMVFLIPLKRKRFSLEAYFFVKLFLFPICAVLSKKFTEKNFKRRRITNNMDYLDEDFYKELDKLILDSKTPDEIIKEKNINVKKYRKELTEFLTEFSSLCQKYELNITNRANFCQKLNKLVKELYSSKRSNENFLKNDYELVFLFCVFAYDHTYLMNNRKKITKSNIISFVELKDEVDTLIDLIKSRRVQKEKFALILKKLPKNINYKKTDKKVNEKEKKKILNIFMNYLGSNNLKDIVKDNIEHILKILHSNNNLEKLSPFFVFEVLKNHKNRISDRSFDFNINNLFKYNEYEIENDNGKNFKSYFNMCVMYSHLVDYYREFDYVDLDLCNYCFYSVSNLCNWFHSYFLEGDGAANNIINNEYFFYPMENIIYDCNIMYFENGLLDCLVYMDYENKDKGNINLTIPGEDNLSVYIYKNLSDNDCISFIENYAKKNIYETKELVKTVFDKIKLPPNIKDNNSEFIYAVIDRVLFYKTEDMLDETMTNTGEILIFENI